MPLRAIDSTSGNGMQAGNFSSAEWQALRSENRARGHLRLPCCGASAVLKTSKRGLQFFAHQARGPCSSGPETEAHLTLKDAAVRAAIRNGWNAETEVSGAGWRADVFASRGRARVAIEVQWSSQTTEETLRRQQRYREAGVRALWLLRQPGFPITHALPAVCIGGTPQEGFTMLVPAIEHMTARQRRVKGDWSQCLEVDEFFDAVFSGRFRFDLPASMRCVANLHTAVAECFWCKSPMRIVERISIEPEGTGIVLADLELEDFDEREELLWSILSRLPADRQRGPVKRRFSRSRKEAYLSNGCPRCGRIFGGFFHCDTAIGTEVNYRVPFTCDANWTHLIEGQESYARHWRIYSA